MDRIDLPLVPGDVPLSRVFDRMAESGVHAAIVAVPGREPAIVTNVEVDEALERGLERTRDLKGRPLHMVNAEFDDWESALDRVGRSFGAVIERGGVDEPDGGDVTFRHLEKVGEVEMITIVTRHETLARDIRHAGEVCRCTKNHRAPRGKPCPLCRSKVRCA